MESLRVGYFKITTCELKNPLSHFPTKLPPFHHIHKFSTKWPRFAVTGRSHPGSELSEEDLLGIFLKERQLNGDFISKISDLLWRRDGLRLVEAESCIAGDDLPLFPEVIENENAGGFLKLKETQEWIMGDNLAPFNKKLSAKEWENDKESRKKLSLLKYDALKRELLLLTSSIGAACSGYCLVTLSVQAAISYAMGVLFSCLYLQLLYHYTDNISREVVPRIFMQKKSKKIGIRSEDLQTLLERTLKGSTLALSSPRLMFPAVIYGCWGLSHHFFNNSFDFQLVPAMFGLFAYKAAALVQLYRDNEGLGFVFPESQGDD